MRSKARDYETDAAWLETAFRDAMNKDELIDISRNKAVESLGDRIRTARRALADRLAEIYKQQMSVFRRAEEAAAAEMLRIVHEAKPAPHVRVTTDVFDPEIGEPEISDAEAERGR